VTNEALPIQYTPPLLPELYNGARLSPASQPLAPPPWLGPDYAPNWKALTERTPKDYRRVARDKNGSILFRYAPIAHFIKVANKCWGVGNWSYEIVREESTEPNASGNFEYTVVIQFVAPCIFRPVVGVGSSTYYANNPQESMAKTRNAALTSALKAALKQFGVGRDIEEDDGEISKVVDGRVATISQVYKRLITDGRADEAKRLFRKLAPDALLDGGELLPGAIEFESLEPLQRGLQELIINGAAAKAKAASQPT